MDDIQIGDLVMVVRPTECCKSLKGIGKIFTVEKVSRSFARCSECGTLLYVFSAYFNEDKGYPVKRLKKIDPPADGDEISTREKEGGTV